MITTDKIEHLDDKLLALWTYIRNYGKDEAIHGRGIHKKYPFIKHLFSPAPDDLEDLFNLLVKKKFLNIQDKTHATYRRMIEENPHKTRSIVSTRLVDTSRGFVRKKMNEIIKNIRLHDLLELGKSLSGSNFKDPFLQSFSEDLRLGRQGWWEIVCNLANLYESVEQKHIISKLLFEFAKTSDLKLTMDKVALSQKVDKIWKENGIVEVEAIVNDITPWKVEMPIEIIFVQWQNISLARRDQIKSQALKSLLNNAIIAHIIIPVGNPDERDEHTLRSTQLAIFTPEESKNIFIDNNPKNLFGELLRSKMDIEILSPYQVTYSVPEAMFFGRDEHLRLIAAHPETNYAIYGSRRSGKTSLMGQIKRLYENEYKPIAFINGETISCEELFFATLCNALNIKSVRSYADFEDAAKAIKPDTLLLIDEIDRALETCDPVQILGILRHLSGQYRVRCIFAGTTVLYKQYHDIKSPMFNFADPLLLGPFTEREAMDLAREPMLNLGVMYENGDSTIKQLVNLCGCFPNLIQLMCHELIREVKRRKTDRIITSKMLKSVFEGNAFGDRVYQQFHHNFNSYQKLIVYTSLMVKSMSLKSITERVQEHYKLSISRIEGLLDELTLLFVFEKTGTTYKWQYEGFPAILKKQVGNTDFRIEQTIMEIKKETKDQ